MTKYSQTTNHVFFGITKDYVKFLTSFFNKIKNIVNVSSTLFHFHFQLNKT